LRIRGFFLLQREIDEWAHCARKRFGVSEILSSAKKTSLRFLKGKNVGKQMKEKILVFLFFPSSPVLRCF
jgi:hypothetical protein